MSVKIQEILDAQNSLPAFQKKEAEAAYSGQKIFWELEFSNVYPNEEGGARILSFGPNKFPWIYFEVSLEDYPEFKLLHEGRKINVSATIDTVTGPNVNLKEVTGIEFVEEDIIEGPEDDPVISVEKSTNQDIQTEENKGGLVKQILLHPVYAGLIVVFLLFVIYKVTGINLRDFAL